MKSSRGFSLPSAIFLLVVLSLLGAFMVSLSTTQSITSAQDYRGSQAYRAARAGIEWAMYQLKSPAIACPAASTPLTIDGFSVTVTCALPTTYDEAGTSRYIFIVKSTATAGGSVGSIGYVERELSATVEF
jgi:MSHA biogenesis protein MshP